MIKRLIILAVIVAGLIALLLYSQYRPVPAKVSGFIEGHEIRVGSRVGGRIARVQVEEGQKVTTGAPLLELEPFDLQQRRAQAAALAAARRAEADRAVAGLRPEEIAEAQATRDRLAATLDKLLAGPRPQEIRQAEAQVDQATAQRDLAQANYNRIKRLYQATGANVSQEEMDQATDQIKVAGTTLKVRQEELDLLKEGTRKEDIAAARAQLAEAEAALTLAKKGSRAEDIAAAQAAAAAAEAEVAAIDRALAELTVKAPADSLVEAVEIRPGDLVAPNAPALALLDLSELWVRAYVPENRLDLQVGQELRISVDSFPGRTFNGRVSFVARQAEFTPSNVQTPEERSKQVFRIKVMLDDEARKVLRPGMAADVWLSGGGKR